jgi:hypothetical protein
MASERAPSSRPWYLSYPIASFITLISAGTVTVAIWTVLVALAKRGTAGDLGTDILAWLAYVVIVAALFTIMWYFQPGIFTSIIIAFVAWCHLGVIGLAIVMVIIGGEYDGPNLLVVAIPCIVLPVAVIHGVEAGSRRGEAL